MVASRRHTFIGIVVFGLVAAAWATVRALSSVAGGLQPAGEASAG